MHESDDEDDDEERERREGETWYAGGERRYLIIALFGSVSHFGLSRIVESRYRTPTLHRAMFPEGTSFETS